jgi:hypothetical protein
MVEEILITVVQVGMAREFASKKKERKERKEDRGGTRTKLRFVAVEI